MSVDLFPLFGELPIGFDAAGIDRFRVVPIPESEGQFVGRDIQGFPCLLLASSDPGVRPPIRLDSIEVRFAMPCMISDRQGNQVQETLTVVVCKATDAEAQRYFIHVCETILRIVGQAPSFEMVARAMQRLVDLFRRLALPATRPLIGLFGELMILSRSRDAYFAAQAWRSSVDSRFDFSINEVRFEVKASATRSRAHTFSLEQCNPPDGTLGVLASMFVEVTGGGLPLFELVRRIESRLLGRDDLILKVQDIVSETLGGSLPTALSVRFDETLARASTKFYDLRSIPALRGTIPIGVTEVRFKSDLAQVPDLARSECEGQSEGLRRLLSL